MKENYNRLLKKLEQLMDDANECDALNQQYLADGKDTLTKLEKFVERLDWKKLKKFSEQRAQSQSMSEEYPLASELEPLEEGFALYSDGACRGNPGPGAWGCLAQSRSGEILFESSGADLLTTNNKMEILGGVQVMKLLDEYLKENGIDHDIPVFFYCDSRYVVDGIEKWIPGWKRRGWRKSDNKEPENLELWRELDEQAQKFSNLKCLWVKAHAGHPQNERCDQLANYALDELELS